MLREISNTAPDSAAKQGGTRSNYYNDNFTIQVQMYNCSVAPCYYALALYGRQVQ